MREESEKKKVIAAELGGFVPGDISRVKDDVPVNVDSMLNKLFELGGEKLPKVYEDIIKGPSKPRTGSSIFGDELSEFKIRTNSEADACFNGIISSSSLSGRSTPAMIFIRR